MEFSATNQKSDTSFPTLTLKNNGQVGQSSYVHTKGKHSHIGDAKPKRKSESERLEIKYRTKKKLVNLLSAVGEGKTAESMALCGARFDVLTCGQHIVAQTPNHRCNVRYCVLCANRRANKYQKKYLPFASAFLKFTVDELGRIVKRRTKITPCLLTLTQVKIKGEKLKDSRERVLSSFRNFIRHDFFDDYFDGGLFTVDNKTSDDGNHLHLHIVVYRKKFIDADLLKEEWAKVSEGAENLNIKRIEDVGTLEDGLRECIKYVSKPLDIENFEREHLLELLEIKGKRMIDTFGEFRKFCQIYKPEEKPEEEPKKEKQKLEEGNYCYHCNDDSVLFHVSMSAQQKIDFYRQIEARGSPPTQNQ
jgi:hypothetical protein